MCIFPPALNGIYSAFLCNGDLGILTTAGRTLSFVDPEVYQNQQRKTKHKCSELVFYSLSILHTSGLGTSTYLGIYCLTWLKNAACKSSTALFRDVGITAVLTWAVQNGFGNTNKVAANGHAGNPTQPSQNPPVLSPQSQVSCPLISSLPKVLSHSMEVSVKCGGELSERGCTQRHCERQRYPPAWFDPRDGKSVVSNASLMIAMDHPHYHHHRHHYRKMSFQPEKNSHGKFFCLPISFFAPANCIHFRMFRRMASCSSPHSRAERGDMVWVTCTPSRPYCVKQLGMSWKAVWHIYLWHLFCNMRCLHSPRTSFSAVSRCLLISPQLLSTWPPSGAPSTEYMYSVMIS